MEKTDKEDQIKKMAGFLLGKATMLKDHCPKCGLPLFKEKGNNDNIFCSQCGSVENIKGEGKSFKGEIILGNKGEAKEGGKVQTHEKIPSGQNNEMENFILENKRNILMKRLVEEDNLDNINKILEALERLKRMMGQ